MLKNTYLLGDTMTEMIEELPKGQGWKKAWNIWRHGGETLREIMAEILIQEPPVTYVDANGKTCPLVKYFYPVNGGVATYYMQETPEALSAMENYLLTCATKNPERTAILATVDEDRRPYRKEISLKEYVSRFHNACLIPDVPENEDWLVAPKIWRRGYETLLTIMEYVCEQVPQVTYQNNEGRQEPLVCKFRNGRKITYYMKATPEALSAMANCLTEYIADHPNDQIFSIVRNCDGKEYQERVSGAEYVEGYCNACLVPEVPEQEEWKVASGVWRNGTKYGFGKIMEEAFEKGWKDASGNLLVQHFRNGVEISYYMKDTPESLSAMHEKMMMLAIFDPEHGTKSNLRRTLKSFTTYLLKKNLGLSVGCPKTEDDWDQAQDAWKKEAKEAYPNQTPAEGLRIYIQEKTGVVFTPEIMKKCFAEDPQEVANQQAERDFYKKYPNLKPKGNSR